VLRILAGSELKELEPALVSAARGAGVDLRLSYAGTLEIVDRVNLGERFDAVLPPNGAYPMLALSTRPVAREKLFYSRVALGVKRSRARALGWDAKAPSWADISMAAASGRFSYAMTNPTSSNTGMSALFAVASSSAGKTEDLALTDINRDVLTAFLRGQKVTAGSSGWLADAYLRDQAMLDGLVNYEAVLLRLNDRPELTDKLLVIYPADGVISADYPLLLMNDAKRPLYERVVGAVRARDFQSGPVAEAYLRPSNPDAPLAKALSAQPVAELSFPNNLALIDAVLVAYQGELRRPATSIYLLDTSGSMEGERLAGVRRALEYLTGTQGSGTLARLARFQSRERVILVRFSDEIPPPVEIDFGAEGDHARERSAIHEFDAGLRAHGGTAIFSALARAFAIADEERARDPDRLVTIVLLTDGENRDGIGFSTLARRMQGRSAPRTFPILFGDARSDELERVAEMTGGRVFDGRSGALTNVFREIRGYQ
jgi:Ca-activated chloride channel family protein